MTPKAEQIEKSKPSSVVLLLLVLHCALICEHVKLYRKRIAATRPQQFMGTISQMAAALTHHVTADRLAKISSSIPRVTIVTSDDDFLVHPSNSFRLKEHMPEANFIQWENTGHALHVQWSERFNTLLESTFQEGRRRLGGA